jgi:RNA polymerase sigma-70 factor, ECF subfamily
VPFDEVAEVVGRPPAATRQLASRARRRVQERAPDPNADLAVQRRVVDAFLAAARSGDFDALVQVLDPNVTFRIDAGGVGPMARPPLAGAAVVAREILARGRGFAGYARPAIVNGAAGVVVRVPGRPPIIGGLTVVDGRIAAIDLIADPAKLGGFHETSGGLE